jgi:hypothetical protein
VFSFDQSHGFSYSDFPGAVWHQSDGELRPTIPWIVAFRNSFIGFAPAPWLVLTKNRSYAYTCATIILQVHVGRFLQITKEERNKRPAGTLQYVLVL